MKFFAILGPMFQLISQSPLGRRGRIVTAHGTIETPVFFPVGTAGAMRGISFEDLDSLGAQVLLCNTYHLHLQPGENTVESAGGLHEFIGWRKPILTDSGGFQVFSLGELGMKIVENGVHFKSHLDGSPLFIGPEEAMTIQHKLGADIIMCFDQCPSSVAPRIEIEAAVDRTLRWAKECKNHHERLKSQRMQMKQKMQKKNSAFSSDSFDSSASSASYPQLFGIVQGGLHRDLRKKCAEELIAIGFDGYAVGGLAVGETEDEMYGVLDDVCPLLPDDKPRYLMGVGRVSQHREAIKRGIDMFDCVLPMREARHGTLYLNDGESLRIINAKFKNDHTVIDAESPSPMSRHHKRSYLHHLFKAKERLAETIACMQNMGVTLAAMRELHEEMKNA
jgi:queuine tRNA-ribosyltransferase